MGLLNTFLRFAWNGVFNLTGMDISFDIEFRDFSFYLIELRADYSAMKKRFEHIGLVPVETNPNETRLQVVCLDMRNVQLIEAYHEMSIHVPVEPLDDRKTDAFVHLYLPVTSEEARWGGVDVNGFPKFIASINIEQGDAVTECTLHNDEGLVLGYSLENHAGAFNELAWDMYGVRKDKVIRTSFEFHGNICEIDNVDSARIYFGGQNMSKELENLLVSNEIEKIIIGEQLSGILKKPVIIKTT